MTHQILHRVSAQIDAFPALPSIVSKVLAITADPESSANNLMEAILPDQSMCAAILKVANSAFYGLPREISTIEKAIVVLGQEEIRNIIIGKAIFSSFPKMKEEHRAQIALFWEHAFTCGLAAKIMAPQFGLSSSELFIAGLIHDIGKLAMLMTFPDSYPLLHDLSTQYCSPGTAEEKADFSISHDMVGLQLADRWLLPRQLVMAIGFHHNPQAAPCFRHYPLLIQAADSLALLYDNLDISAGRDVVEIFRNFLPETEEVWQNCDLTWHSDDVGVWFEKLQQLHEEEHSVFEVFSRP